MEPTGFEPVTSCLQTRRLNLGHRADATRFREDPPGAVCCTAVLYNGAWAVLESVF